MLLTAQRRSGYLAASQRAATYAIKLLGAKLVHLGELRLHQRLQRAHNGLDGRLDRFRTVLCCVCGLRARIPVDRRTSAGAGAGAGAAAHGSPRQRTLMRLLDALDVS